MTWSLHLGDGLAHMATLPDASIHAIITDLPYQVTNCAWDTIIPFAPMWEQVKRVLKPRGVFVTTASQPFTSKLVMSNLEWFKYEWIWEKDQVTNPQLAKYMPLKNHESVLVFADGKTVYNPQGLQKACIVRRADSAGRNLGHLAVSKPYTQEFTNYPKMVLRFNVDRGEHPTQKPVALYAYLIRTYTNPGDTVLDFCAGSGTTGVAAIKEGRGFVGVELDESYYRIALKRIQDAAAQPMLIPVEAL